MSYNTSQILIELYGIDILNEAWHRVLRCRAFFVLGEVMNVKSNSIRAQNPFDDGADDRLIRMGLLSEDGTASAVSVTTLSQAFAGLLFDEMCDFYQDYSIVQDELRRLFDAAEQADGRQRFLMICLQYDRLCRPLPDPVWWISGNPSLASQFAGSYIRHLQNISNIEEVAQE